MNKIQDTRPHAAVLRMARVVKVYPETHRVDVVFIRDGGRATSVPVLAHKASQGHGAGFLPEMEEPADGKWSPGLHGQNDLICMVALCDSLPVVVGFFHPQVGAMGFKDQPNLEVERHPSDYYSVTTDAADMAMHHPGGSFIAMGAAVPKVAPKSDYDQQWELKRNVEISATIRLHSTEPGGAAQGDVTVAPGRIGIVEFNGGGMASLDMNGGNAEMDASQQIAIKAPIIKLN